MSTIELNQNFDASDEYALGGVCQGAAVVVSNTGLEEVRSSVGAREILVVVATFKALLVILTIYAIELWQACHGKRF